jgi:hypothetical protein
LETSDTADLDNYAKSILDGLKGPDGILLDDTQVQTLIISYIDNYEREGPFFDVSIGSAVGLGTGGGRVRVYASRPPHRTPDRGSADPVSRQ